MAQTSGTFSSYDAVGNRESLMDRIFLLAREETPLLSNVRQGKASAKNEEWQVDSLAAAATNAQVEGDEFAYTQPASTTRVGNRLQISRKTAVVTRTQNQVNKAGRDSEMSYQIMKRTKELRRDMEFDLNANNTAVAGNDTTAAELGGWPAWLTTNVSRGSGGANGGFTGGFATAATDGTQRAFTETLLKAVHKAAWDAGGRPRLAMMGSAQKQVFSTFTGLAANRVNQSASGQATIIAASDVYVGDFGKLTTVLNPFMRTREVLLLDTEMMEVRYLQKPKIVDVAPNGDAEKKAIITEYTLAVLNEAAHGVVADLT